MVNRDQYNLLAWSICMLPCCSYLHHLYCTYKLVMALLEQLLMYLYKKGMHLQIIFMIVTGLALMLWIESICFINIHLIKVSTFSLHLSIFLTQETKISSIFKIWLIKNHIFHHIILSLPYFTINPKYGKFHLPYLNVW